MFAFFLFCDVGGQIADKNKEEKEVEVGKENKDGTFTTKKEIQTKILGYDESSFKKKFKFTEDNYKFSIENFKEKLEENNKNEQEANKQTLSDFVIDTSKAINSVASVSMLLNSSSFIYSVA